MKEEYSDVEPKLAPRHKRKLQLIMRKLRAYDPQRVILFGSYVRNESDDLSDIDLVIVKETEEDFFARIRTVLDLLDMKSQIDVLVYTPAEFETMRRQGNPFIETVIEEGIVLHGWHRWIPAHILRERDRRESNRSCASDCSSDHRLLQNSEF